MFTENTTEKNFIYGLDSINRMQPHQKIKRSKGSLCSLFYSEKYSSLSHRRTTFILFFFPGKIDLSYFSHLKFFDTDFPHL